MANFSYSDYQNVIAKAQSGDNNGSTKIGFFKMKNDQDEALVRINVATLNDLQFATVHQLGAAQKWMKVSCLNPVGSYYDTCPLCAAVSGGAKDIGKAAKKVYVQMLVSYKDATTGQFSTAIPVIWERPAGFSTEIATLLRDYGDLTQRVFKVTRNGAAGNMKTTYSISYIPIFDKPESVPTDFSAFANFNIAKHSFWEKSAGEIQVFLNTGSFPEPARAPQPPMPSDADVPTYTKPVYAESYTAPAAGTLTPQEAGVAPTYQAPVAPQYQPPVTPAYQPPVVPSFEAPAAPAPVPAPTAPITPEAPIAPSAPAQPNNQPVGSEFGRAPRSFGGIAF
jgi:hypothetical protein